VITELAPGIHRLGDSIVNSYLVVDGTSVTIVDAGAPSYWNDLPVALGSIGRSLDDVRTILLTHGHSDHVGFAERARQHGATVRVHEADAALARGDVKNSVKVTGGYRLRPSLGFFWWSATHGLLRVPRLRVVATFGDGATLDVPGAPRVIHAPGHTAGSAALHFPGHDALFVGDALNTYAVTTGLAQAQLSPFNADRAQALRSLARLEGVPASLVLPGHGLEWRDGIRNAVRRVRETEALSRG
jgi:glyoxylase-like metal-dependent hydrolase (beta-lactamase superfamily II)